MGIFDWKHWAVILLVMVLVFGTNRLRSLGSDVGGALKGFRKAMDDDAQDEPQPRPQISANDERGNS